MAKLTRYTQTVFGSSAGANQMAEFGSLAAGSPLTYSGATITPAIVQTLANYLTGWFGAVIGANSPAIEDMNALCYLFAYQLAYLMEMGVPEYDAATIYYTTSIVQSGGQLYISLTDANTGNAVTNTSFWALYGKGDLSAGSISLTSNTTLTAVNNGQAIETNTTAGSFTVTLPAAPVAGQKFHFKDIGYASATNPLTISGNGKNIEGLAANYLVYANGWDRIFYYDGTAYWIL